MKQPSNVTRLARADSYRVARLTARDLAQVRAIAAAANVRISRRKALLFGGSNATAAAEALAQRLGRDIFHVDLSAMVSKYIGETEENLERVFSDAEANDALLLFDEADALFGKRTSVKDAHDRYSNIEVDYLLQRIEAYDGVAVLASKWRLLPSIALRRKFPPTNFRRARRNRLAAVGLDRAKSGTSFRAVLGPSWPSGSLCRGTFRRSVSVPLGPRRRA